MKAAEGALAGVEGDRVGGGRGSGGGGVVGGGRSDCATGESECVVCGSGGSDEGESYGLAMAGAGVCWHFCVAMAD